MMNKGGRQLDLFEHAFVNEADNYTDAANQFIEGSDLWLNQRYTQNQTGENAILRKEIRRKRLP